MPEGLGSVWTMGVDDALGKNGKERLTDMDPAQWKPRQGASGLVVVREGELTTIELESPNLGEPASDRVLAADEQTLSLHHCRHRTTSSGSP